MHSQAAVEVVVSTMEFYCDNCDLFRPVRLVREGDPASRKYLGFVCHSCVQSCLGRSREFDSKAARTGCSFIAWPPIFSTVTILRKFFLGPPAFPQITASRSLQLRPCGTLSSLIPAIRATSIACRPSSQNVYRVGCSSWQAIPGLNLLITVVRRQVEAEQTAVRKQSRI